MRLVASAVGNKMRPELVVIGTLAAAIMRVLGFSISPAASTELLAWQLDGYVVVGKPWSSHPVETPTGTLAVVKTPCTLYDVTRL